MTDDVLPPLTHAASAEMVLLLYEMLMRAFPDEHTDLLRSNTNVQLIFQEAGDDVFDPTLFVDIMDVDTAKSMARFRLAAEYVEPKKKD